MKNILIISGGSGSQNLQRGLYEKFGKSVNTTVLTNAYDNGKSTGTVRTVYNDSILGPSDVRKNQLLKHNLFHCTNFSKETVLSALLDYRFDADSMEEAREFVLNLIMKYSNHDMFYGKVNGRLPIRTDDSEDNNKSSEFTENFVNEVLHAQVGSTPKPEELDPNYSALDDVDIGMDVIIETPDDAAKAGIHDTVFINDGDYEQYHLNDEAKAFLLAGAKAFFDQPKANEIKYEDFAIGNIVYAGIAGKNGNSLQAAADIMGEILGIPKNSVVLNDDKSLFLRAVTESGHQLICEGQIVDHNNPQDPITHIGFERFNDPIGKIDTCDVKTPRLSERAKEAIENSDMIIFSSGTQWSSLIPTYMTVGFREAIDNSFASKYLIMNCARDNDMKEKNALDLRELLSKYLDFKYITTVYDTNARGFMDKYPKDSTPKLFKRLSEGDGKHDPQKLVDTIFEHEYQSLLDPSIDCLALDYDDTIRSRKRGLAGQSKYGEVFWVLPELERYGYNIAVITGNDIKEVEKLGCDAQYYATHQIKYHWDGKSRSFVKIANLSRAHEIADIEEVKNELSEILEIDLDKIQIRERIVIAIKPITEGREAVRRGIEAFYEHVDSEAAKGVVVKRAGNTTIEISIIPRDSKRTVSKFYALEDLRKQNSNIFYIADEPEGNDKAAFEWIRANKMESLVVDDPTETYVALKTLLDWRMK